MGTAATGTRWSSELSIWATRLSSSSFAATLTMTAKFSGSWTICWSLSFYSEEVKPANQDQKERAILRQVAEALGFDWDGVYVLHVALASLRLYGDSASALLICARGHKQDLFKR